MNTVPIVSHKSRLEELFKRVTALPDESLELRADFAAYLCVRISGFVEDSVHHLYAELARAKSIPVVANFASSQLGRVQNLNAERLCKLVGRFDPGWREELEGYLDGPRKDALDGLVANRNRIAHGEWVGVTVTRMSDDFDRAVEVVDFLEGQCRAIV